MEKGIKQLSTKVMVQTKRLPTSLMRAAGLLANKKKLINREYKKIRAEWK